MKRIIATILAVAMLSFVTACNHESEPNNYDNYDFQLTYIIEQMDDFDVDVDGWLIPWWVGVSLDIVTTKDNKVI